MSVNEEALLRVMATSVAQAVTQAMEAMRQTAGGGGPKAAKSLHKFYTRLEKFGGEDGRWKEWHYQFGVATNAYDTKTAMVMELVERIELTEITTDQIQLELEDAHEEWMTDTHAGLFSVLCLLTSGEANMLVRSCEDKNGYTAWKKLYDRFNPKTPASLTAAWREVVRPKKVKDLREAGKAIDVWEGKVAALKKEHGEEPTVGLKASLLLEMLPDSAQMTVAQGMNSKKLDYETLKAKIKLMANVQIDYSTPKPMDIGELKDDSDEPYWNDEGEDFYVDAIGTTTCHRCGGVGHFARECGTAKGKGKDIGKGKGFGKGTGKDGGKGKGKDSGKGKGKGCYNCGGNHFARECPHGGVASKGGGKTNRGCFTCGGYGHRAAECPTIVRAIEHEDEEESDRSIGSMWMCEVGSLDGWRVARAGCRGAAGCRRGAEKFERAAFKSPSNGVRVETSNRFAALTGNNHQLENWVQSLQNEEAWKEAGTAEITIDSAADESVCPWDWGKAFRTKEVAEMKKMRFRNASGGKMEHYGEKRVTFMTNDQDRVIGMDFQVSDVKRPLAAVWRIAEKGNLVQFGPRREDNFIRNIETGERTEIRRKGRSYVLDVELVKRAVEEAQKVGAGESPFRRQA